MDTIFINFDTITENTTTTLDVIDFKGAPSINFVLTGIDETVNKALTMDIQWGDDTDIQFAQKDIVFNYKKKSILDEVLYGKVGGTILNQYIHTYVPTASSYFTEINAQFLIYFNNGFYANITQPIKLIRESYYDDIQKLGIMNTQMVGLSSSNTVANLQSKYNKRTYTTFLEKE